MKKFPHLVQMHQKLKDQGLVVYSLNVSPSEISRKKDIEGFLQKNNAFFTNYIVQDEDDNLASWQARHEAEATPSYVVFNRLGQRVPVTDDEKIEELLEAELAKK